MSHVLGRVCRPETYRVKSIIHRALQLKTAEIHNLTETARNDRPSARKRKRDATSLLSHPEHRAQIEELVKLLELYDDILLDEAPPSDKALPRRTSQRQAGRRDPTTPHETGESLTCDFCTGDIFNGFLECPSCEEDSTMDDGNVESVIICPGCYTEGRTCRCGEMMPRQCRNFETLLNDRAQAFGGLAGTGVLKQKAGKKDAPKK